MAEWTSFSLVPTEFVTAGDTVVSLGDFNGVHGATGKTSEARYAHVWTVRTADHPLSPVYRHAGDRRGSAIMDRVAIVTGASRGVGRATAIRLARNFGAVALVARTRETLDGTADAVRAAGAEPLVFACDLREPAAAGAIVAATREVFGRIDAIACIAGAVPQVDLFALTDEQWDDGLALKFHSARRLTIAAWDALRSSNGSVAITSGTSAYTPHTAELRR